MLPDSSLGIAWDRRICADRPRMRDPAVAANAFGRPPDVRAGTRSVVEVKGTNKAA
jgi:hypothetical protein